MNSSLFFSLVTIWSCVDCIWPRTTTREKSFLETALFHDANIGGGLGAGIGGGLGASVGSIIGGEFGASIGGGLGGGVGGAAGGFFTGGPVGALSGVIGGLMGGATGAVHSHRKAANRGCSILGKAAAARIGGILGGATGGYYGLAGVRRYSNTDYFIRSLGTFYA